MKKILVVLLILAVAGGAFAQVTVGGSVETGIAIGITDSEAKADEGGDGAPKIDYIGDRGDFGMNGVLKLEYKSPTNASFGPYGAFVEMKGQIGRFTDGKSFTPEVGGANLWWQPTDMVWIQVGTGGPNPYGTMGGIDRSLGIMDADGLKIRLLPMPGLDMGGQIFYGREQNNEGRYLENTSFAFGLKYTMDDVFSAVANIRYYGARESEEGPVEFGAGFNYLGLSGMGLTALAADVSTWNFGGDNAFIGIGERVEFKAMDDNLTVGARAQQFIWMGDADYSFIPMLFQGSLSYKMDWITPGIEARYMIGSGPEFNYRHATEIGGLDNALSFSDGKVADGSKWRGEDAAAFGISPYISFNVGPEIRLGYNLQMDMSKDATNEGTSKKVQHLIYAGIRVGF